jgi:hypothetical protein
MDCGDELIAAKAELPHGAWLPWLEENCPNITARTCANYMRLARHREQIGKDVSDFGVREALDLIANKLPAPARKPEPEARVVQLAVHHEVRPPTKVLMPVYDAGTVQHPQAPRYGSKPLPPVEDDNVVRLQPAAQEPTVEPEVILRAFGESRLLYAWREATPEERRELVMKHADEIRRFLDAN